MEYTRDDAWCAFQAHAIRRGIAAGLMEDDGIEDRAEYERGLELLKTARIVATDPTTTPLLVAENGERVLWYKVLQKNVAEINEAEAISPVFVFEVGHIATSPAYIAVAFLPRRYATASEAAAFTGTAASGWRNRAAAGEIPGAIKRGKTWLIPWPQS